MPIYGPAPEAAPAEADPTLAGVPVEANPHFRRIGGEAGLARLVECFYARMDRDPQAAVIRAMHDEDLGATKAVLVRYLTQWMGGPARYTPERGQPQLRRRHLRFAIGPAEADAWMHCMDGALDDVGAAPDLKQQLAAAFRKVADSIRNDEGSTHHDHHPHPAHPDRRA
ncbi:MAG: group II truncated hemoglobin [Zoogloea sp.]|nr:group II truncated hemoglobin [Zoogloea sp.]